MWNVIHFLYLFLQDWVLSLHVGRIRIGIILCRIPDLDFNFYRTYCSFWLIDSNPWCACRLAGVGLSAGPAGGRTPRPAHRLPQGAPHVWGGAAAAAGPLHHPHHQTGDPATLRFRQVTVATGSRDVPDIRPDNPAFFISGNQSAGYQIWPAGFSVIEKTSSQVLVSSVPTGQDHQNSFVYPDWFIPVPDPATTL